MLSGDLATTRVLVAGLRTRQLVEPLGRQPWHSEEHSLHSLLWLKHNATHTYEYVHLRGDQEGINNITTLEKQLQ